MRNAILCILVIGVLGAAWLPPVFTHGACTAEFDAVSNQLQAAKPEILTVEAARHYFAAHGMPYRLLTAAQCEAAPPADVDACPEGTLLVGAVPVANRVCRYYRDRTVRFQLGFNRLAQLVHIQTDMNPYRIFKLPIADLEIDLGK
jgi:hypothetical protein